jgi:ABC-type multidrug transport system fused ATPase/permease subunit
MSDEFRKIEYDNLYKEILENANKVYQVLNICVSGTAALLGFAFTLDPSKLPSKELSLPFLLLLPFSIILPSMVFVNNSHNSTVRIATYLRVFYEEEQKDVSWQKRLQKLRQKGKQKYRVFSIGLRSMFVRLGSACIALSILYSFYVWNQWLNRWIELILYCLLVTFLGWRLRSLSKEIEKKWSTEFFDELIEFWEALKEEEKRI